MMDEVTGWGRAVRSLSLVREPAKPSDIHIESAPRGQLAHGLGRSYGDAALNTGGVLWRTTALKDFHLDLVTGRLEAQAGTSVADLLEHSVPRGWFLPVTPGTMHVTLGGAFAADVHGKNHHRDGSFADHVTSLTLRKGDGETVGLQPTDPLFGATAGGMGLTGVILDMEVQMLPIASSVVMVQTLKTQSLTETMAGLSAADAEWRYTVAWIDAHSDGKTAGRGVITAGDFAPRGSLDYRNPRALGIPDLFPSGLVRDETVSLFNELWWRKAMPSRVPKPQSIHQFFYPLDALDRWNRVYGRRGFLQYQFVIPDSSEEAISATLETLSRNDVPVALAVLKRFGRGRGLLSFPVPGWTLALDIPAGNPLHAAALDELDHIVADAGGRVYLAKDGRMKPGLLDQMYPELADWRRIRDAADPDGRMQSDLDRRLGLSRSHHA